MNIQSIISSLPPFFRRHKLVQLLLLISPNSHIQLIKFNDLSRLWANVSDPNPRNCLITESFEPEFFEIAKPFLANGGVFFDIGANFGFCSFGLIGTLPRRKIEYNLFEANPDIYKILLRSAKLYPEHTIRINHCCVTEQAGMSQLKVVKHQLGMSFIADEGDYEVRNLILDQYLRDYSINKIHFMKMDIEGWETFALKGAKSSLEDGIVDTLYIEISSENLLRNGLKPEDCLDFLKAVGFQLFYCRSTDFKSDLIRNSKDFILNINGYQIKIYSLESFPAKYQTDILAIHNKSNHLQHLK